MKMHDKMRRRAAGLVAIVLCIFMLAGCKAKGGEQTESGNTQSQTLQSQTQQNTGSQSDSVNQAGSQAAQDTEQTVTQIAVNDSVSYKKADEYSAWQDQNPVYIKLSGTSAEITGAGATAKGSIVTITAPGVYVISGKTEDGQILVNSDQDGTVRLVLNGAEIKSSSSAAIYVKKADKTVISLEAGTENSIRDAESYVFSEPEADEPNAAIFSDDDLTINGSGSLKVYGNYNNGINVKDDLRITGGSIYIKAVDDGILGRDLTAIREGTINIEAGGDALKATNDEDAAKGFVLIEGGTITLTSGSDGIQAESSVVIKAGEITINSGGGSVNAKTSDNVWNNPWGGRGNQASASDEPESGSAKGIKCAAAVQITGGSLVIDSSDDAIHSNGSIQVKGGSIKAASGDDGIHADTSIVIEDGDITITKSYEGIESAAITVAGGSSHVTASDDGFNAAGGNDGSALGGRWGQNSFDPSVAPQININGGAIVLNANGDGLDSNGTINMTGGTVLVSGPINDGNGALDYGYSFDITGGLLIAAGSSGMAQATSESSQQHAVMMTYNSIQKAGTIVRLEDSRGTAVVTFAPAKNYQSILLSSPSLKAGETYTLYSGGTVIGSTRDGLYTEGAYSGGTKVNSFSITNIVTWLNSDGVTQGGGGFSPGGGRMPGGGGKSRPGGGFGRPGDGMQPPGTMPVEPGTMPVEPGTMPGEPGTMPGEGSEPFPGSQPDMMPGEPAENLPQG